MQLSPEQVEADVGNWGRQLYKLAKGLTGLKGPLKVVEHIKEKLEDFKGNLPLITALLNPGMRDRHWKSLAASCGGNVQPNDTTTLASLIEQKVRIQSPHLPLAAALSSPFLAREWMRRWATTWRRSRRRRTSRPRSSRSRRRSTRCSTSGSPAHSTAWSMRHGRIKPHPLPWNPTRCPRRRPADP